MKHYRLWMKKTKDAVRPDYFLDTLAENGSQASLDAESYSGDYVDLCIPKIVIPLKRIGDIDKNKSDNS
jgi:hypothetical protein